MQHETLNHEILKHETLKHETLKHETLKRDKAETDIREYCIVFFSAVKPDDGERMNWYQGKLEA